MRPETLTSLLAARAAKQQVALVSNLETGDQTLVFRDRADGALKLDDEALDATRDALRDDKSGRLRRDDAPLFVQVFNPPKRMIIVGVLGTLRASTISMIRGRPCVTLTVATPA